MKLSNVKTASSLLRGIIIDQLHETDSRYHKNILKLFGLKVQMNFFFLLSRTMFTGIYLGLYI